MEWKKFEFVSFKASIVLRLVSLVCNKIEFIEGFTQAMVESRLAADARASLVRLPLRGLPIDTNASGLH